MNFGVSQIRRPLRGLRHLAFENSELRVRNHRNAQKDAGNDGAGRCPTGRLPQVSAAMTEGDGSNRIRIVPEL